MNRSDDNLTYLYYYGWSFLLPLVLLAVTVIFSIVTLLLLPPFKEVLKRFEDKALVSAIRDLMIRVNTFFLIEFEEKVEKRPEVKLQFGDCEKGDKHERAMQTVRTYYIYGVAVHMFLVYYLCAVFLIMVLVSIAIFLTTFIADVAFTCGEGFDCFLRNNNTVRFQECGNYSHKDIICFKLAYRYTEGTGEAGGFLFIVQVFVNFMTYLSIRAVSKTNCSKCVTIGIICTVFWMIYVSIVIVLPYTLALRTPEFLDTLPSPKRQLQTFIYGYSHLIASLIPIAVGFGAYRTDNKNEHIDTNTLSTRDEPNCNNDISHNPIFTETDIQY